jgi:hypothetical protein
MNQSWTNYCSSRCSAAGVAEIRRRFLGDTKHRGFRQQALLGHSTLDAVVLLYIPLSHYSDRAQSARGSHTVVRVVQYWYSIHPPREGHSKFLFEELHYCLLLQCLLFNRLGLFVSTFCCLAAKSHIVVKSEKHTTPSLFDLCEEHPPRSKRLAQQTDRRPMVHLSRDSRYRDTRYQTTADRQNGGGRTKNPRSKYISS